MILPTSKKRCSRDSTGAEIFFSLMEYRNNLFTSSDLEAIIRFYDSFQNKDDLVEWMKERPKGVANIQEVDGGKEIIMVIPTADFNGKYAKECRENIFKGLHMIFVESGGKEDFYFNYAHNINVGIRKAMEYNPKWIVVSNDDMAKVDEASVLVNELRKIHPNTADVVFTEPPGRYHCARGSIVKMNIFYIVGLLLIGKVGIMRARLYSKFNIKYYPITEIVKIPKFMYKKVVDLTMVQSFFVISGNFCKKTSCCIFDETYANAMEDTEFSYKVVEERRKIGKIKFRISTTEGGSFGKNPSRILRETAGLVYFNKLHPKILREPYEDPNDSVKFKNRIL